MRNLRVWFLLIVLLLMVGIMAACAAPATPPPAPTVAIPTDIPQEAEPEAEVPTVAPEDVAPESEPTTEIMAPDFTLTDLDGTMRSLSEFQGQVVMLNFWASWCGFCRSEIPHMNTVYADLADEGFEIVAVSLGEEPDHLRQFAAENEMEFPILADVDGITVPIYGIQSVPTSFFLDREGRLREAYGGAIDEETLRTIVESLLDG